VDSVRTLGRLVQQAKGLLAAEGAKVQQRCRSRLRTARRAAQALHRQLRRKGEEQEAEQQRLDTTLVETTEQMVQQATQVVAHLRQTTTVAPAPRGASAGPAAAGGAGHQSDTPARVPGRSEKKVLSLVEPHTKAVLRSPWRRPGRVRAAGRARVRVEGGIITRYEMLAHPTEHGQAVTAVEHHVALFDHPPGLVAADRGVHAADTEQRLRQAGVRHVAIPASGKVSAERRAFEHTPAFRRGIASARAPVAGSPACGGIMGGGNAGPTGWTGWSGGWAWGSWRATCGGSPARWAEKARQNRGDRTPRNAQQCATPLVEFPPASPYPSDLCTTNSY
jgi:IS5 family transposase